MDAGMARLNLQADRLQEKQLEAKQQAQLSVQHARQQDLQALKQRDHENQRRPDPAVEKGRHVDRMA